MVLQVENTVDASLEKHVPVVEVLPADVCRGVDGVKVKIGAEEHPMTEEHYIEWVEIEIEDGRTGKKFLKPGDKPEVIFQTRQKVISIRAYCNLHGLWKKDVE
jgi:superoxide reductase